MNEKKIGVVVAVNAGSIEILLDKSITSLVKELGGKPYIIGQVGTYVLIPIAKLVVLAMVNDCRKIDITQNGTSELRYVLSASLVGTVKNGKYERGVSIVPPVDAPVFLAEDSDLNVAFSIYRNHGFSVGALSLFEKERAYLDPNKFFGKHISILGSSGSGKSCTVSSVLQKIAPLPDTNVVIIDLHNEYKKAFPENCRYLDIAQLEIPFWLMSFEELVEIFVDPMDENAGSQITVLKDLIVESKKGQNPRLADILTIDTPVYFDLAEVRAKIQYLDTERISGLGAQGAKEGPFYAKFSRFIVRLDSKMNDPRYAFMFKPQKFSDSTKLVEFLEDLFGRYGNQKVTILDLSGVPFDIVNTIVAVMARLCFEFNFWNAQRRDFPILLVCEEAHNYLPSQGEARAARRTVERIAKEGRKYGVSLMVVSQRPAEVSETILSQCNNFVILRLTNPIDQNYVKRLMPDTFGSLVDLLPTLRQGEALVVGEAIPMPLRVQIDFPSPEPDSADIRFFEKWKKSEEQTDIARVVQRWWTQER